MKGFYQLKKEIDHLILEEHLNKYARGKSTRGLGESNSQGRDLSCSLGSKKGNEPSKRGEDR